jgi:hypothetical protein
MAKLDADAEVLEEDVNFTWEDIDMPDHFAAPAPGQ